ncbi:hypothetical protein PISMIDRAFT_687399, partial [Pisolithus microcarpus 441]
EDGGGHESSKISPNNKSGNEDLGCLKWRTYQRQKYQIFGVGRSMCAKLGGLSTYRWGDLRGRWLLVYTKAASS